MTAGIYQISTSTIGWSKVVDTSAPSSRPPVALIRGRAPASRWLLRAAKLAVLALTLVLAWRFLDQLGSRQLWLRMRGASGPWIVAAVAALLGRFFLLYLRWSLALGAAGFRPAWILGQASQLAAVLVNHLTPTARLFGGVLRARYVSRQLGQPFSRIYATVLVDQISHQLVLGFITWLALITAAARLGFQGLALGLGLSLVLVIAAMAIWRQMAKPDNARPLATLVGLKAESKGRRLGPLFAGGRELFRALRQSFSDVPLQSRMAATGALIFALNVAAQWLIFEGLGTPVVLVAVTSTIALGLAAGLLTGTPGGVAATEAAMVGLYVSLGVDSVEATAGVLLYRGLHYLLVLSCGLPAIAYCEVTTGGLRRSKTGHAEEAPSDNEMPLAGSPPDSDG